MKKLLIIQGGIPHYRKPVYNELSRHYDVTVLHIGGKSVDVDDTYNEIIAPMKRFGPFFLQSGVMKVMRNGDYDAVIAMFDIRWVANIIAVFLRKKSRFLYWGHRYGKNYLTNRLRDLLMRLSDGVVLYSDAEISQMLSCGIPRSRIFVAPNTIHVSNHSDGSCADKDSFLFVGRAQKRKRIDLLIRAFSEIRDLIPNNTRINIIGAGKENDSLRGIAEQLGVSRHVIFHGEIVANEGLKPFFHSAYAYVSPGPVGLSVLHSFAYGVPVVTAHSGRHGPEFDDLEHGKNSLLYSTYNEFKKTLVNLCNDRSLAIRLGKNAYEHYAENRTLENMVEGFVEAIENKRGSIDQ